MKHAVLAVVLAGMFGSSITTAAPFSQDQTANVFYVFGHVKNPGAYTFTSETMTVSQAIERAGGVTAQGSDRFRVFRIEDGKKVALDAKAEDPIVPGDTIAALSGESDASTLIAATTTPAVLDTQDRRFYVVGLVARPGSYQFIGETMTVGQGIEAAGGLTERASGELRIRRIVDGKRVDAEVQAGDSLRPNDTIAAPMRH